MMSCAMVPTTISESAVEILNQIESRLATNARPSHKAAKAQTLVISPSIILEGQSERRNGIILECWLMLDHHRPPARAVARWQESSAGMAVLGDSIPVGRRS